MSLLLWVLDALRGGWGLPTIGGGLAVALVGAHTALKAADAPRPRWFTTVGASRVLAAGASVVALTVVAAAFGLTAPLAVTFAAALLGAVAVVFALLERRFTPHPASAKTSDGLVHITIPRIVLVGLGAAGLTQTVHYMWSAVGADVMGFATANRAGESLSPWLWAFSSTAIGVVGASYTIRRSGSEPRNIAVLAQLTSGLALLGFVAVAQSADALSESVAVALVVTTVVVTGMGAFQVFALYYTIARERKGTLRANSIFLAAWGGGAFALGLIIAPLLLQGGVPVPALLGGVGALLVVTCGLSRTWPPHPESEEDRPPVIEFWAAFKECRRPLVLVIFGVVILCGVPLTAAWSPLSAASEHWASVEAPFAAYIRPATGVCAVLITVAVAFVGPRLEDKIAVMLFVGAGSIAVGNGLALIPLVEPRWGALTTIAQVVLTEGGANAFLIVVIARLNPLTGRTARVAFAMLCVAKQCSAGPFGYAMNRVQEEAGSYGALLPTLTTASFAASATLVAVAGPLAWYFNQLRKREEAAASKPAG